MKEAVRKIIVCSKPIVVGLWTLCATAALSQTSPDTPAMHSGSLCNEQTGQSVFTSHIAAKKGDIVTILISETSSSSFNNSLTATKKDSNSASMAMPFVDFFKSTLFGALQQGGSNSANSSVAGVGQTSNAQNFVAQISVVVKEVLPNGNLVLEGERWLRVNKESQSVKLIGTIRKDDIRPDNTVLSEMVANARIESDGKGITSERQRKGFLTQMLDWLF